MRKSILILVSLIVLFSLFNTFGTNFKLWDSPSINTNHIITPDIPVSFDTDISLFGLFINFFSDLELDYAINNTVISNESVVAYNISNTTNTISEAKEPEYNTESHEDYEEFIDNTVVEELIEEEVIEEEVIEEEVIEEEVIEEEVYIKSDEEIIRDNSQIKDNAKELILESLENEIITMADVADLLSEYAGKEIKKKHVKKLIKRKKK